MSRVLVTRYNKCSMTIQLQNMVAHAYAILTLTIANVLLHISLNISKKPFLLNKALLTANVSIFKQGSKRKLSSAPSIYSCGILGLHF